MRNYIFTSPFNNAVRMSFGYMMTKNGKTRDFTSEFDRVFPGVYKKTHEGHDLKALLKLNRIRGVK